MRVSHRSVCSAAIRCAGIAFVMACLTAPSAMGHTVLDMQQATQLLAQITRSEEVSKSAKTQEERAEALYGIGRATTELVNLMNADIQAHGSNDPQLLNMILTRLQRYGISVKKSVSGYSYDFAAFAEYLRLAPAGSHAANARFALIQYGEASMDAAFAGVDDLEKSISEESRFVQAYPAFPEAATVQLLLARQHLQVMHLLRSDGRLSDAERDRRSAEHQKTAEDLLRKIVAQHPDSREAADARNYLASFGSR